MKVIHDITPRRLCLDCQAEDPTHGFEICDGCLDEPRTPMSLISSISFLDGDTLSLELAERRQRYSVHRVDDCVFFIAQLT